MENRKCLACNKLFQPRPQSPDQTYCSKKTCQRERRRQWQQCKRESDPEYLENQNRAQKAWIERNPDYWRDYRNRHPQYVEENRAKQLIRNFKIRSSVIAKMDASNPGHAIPNGVYRLIALTSPVIAKKNGWTVSLTLISPAH